MNIEDGDMEWKSCLMIMELKGKKNCQKSRLRGGKTRSPL